MFFCVAFSHYPKVRTVRQVFTFIILDCVSAFSSSDASFMWRNLLIHSPFKLLVKFEHINQVLPAALKTTAPPVCLRVDVTLLCSLSCLFEDLLNIPIM